MSSSVAGASSPSHANTGRRSRFTYRNLAQLAAYNTSCPLRVIAHIDLDAFYAQCEMVRLGIPEDKPLAVQQWQGLIAINYPARSSGIGRHCNVIEAKKLCPDLIAQHVATWREGDDKWAYRDDSAENIATDKVSLDPYRLQSRRILALVKDALPKDKQKVEKASIDEVFLDLSAQIHAILLERFPELRNPPPYDDPNETLPLPSVAALDWKADALVDLEEEQEAMDPDWDDVVMLLGSEIVRDVRLRVRTDLGYTCSAGLAGNKLVSKLGSGFKKPNQQTVVRARAVDSFLAGFKLTKLRNFGGKLGEQVISTFGTETVKELLEVPVEKMKAGLGHETGAWVYNTIRGIDNSEVNSRTQIKSMLSAKSFRPTINTPEQAMKWLRIFVADIYARLVEEGVLENKRRPKTINLHHRTHGQTRSRQGPISSGKNLDELALLELARDLLGQIIAEGKVWPCANLSLSVGGFEDGVKGNMGIDTFLVRGDEAESLRASTPDLKPANGSSASAARKRRADDSGIQRFFAKKPSLETQNTGDDTPPGFTSDEAAMESPRLQTEDDLYGDHTLHDNAAPQASEGKKQVPITSFFCPRCNENFESAEVLQSHRDWHMAMDLQEEMQHEQRSRAAPVEQSGGSRGLGQKKGAGGAASKRGGRGGRMEQGQSRLKFG